MGITQEMLQLDNNYLLFPFCSRRKSTWFSPRWPQLPSYYGRLAEINIQTKWNQSVSICNFNTSFLDASFNMQYIEAKDMPKFLMTNFLHCPRPSACQTNQTSNQQCKKEYLFIYLFKTYGLWKTVGTLQDSLHYLYTGFWNIYYLSTAKMLSVLYKTQEMWCLSEKTSG